MSEPGLSPDRVAPRPVASDATSLAADVSPPFFPVSITKLVVMSVCTFGFYEVYWFYRNWRLARERGAHVRPALRALFAIFFCHSLFRIVRDRAGDTAARDDELRAGPLAIGWIVVSLLGGLPDPYWLVSFCAVVFVVPVQMSANRYNRVRAPRHDPNDRFGTANWIAIVGGGLLLTLVVIGMFTPPMAS